MSEIIHLKSVAHAHKIMGIEPPKHPLISIYYHNKPNDKPMNVKFSADLYLIAMKDGVSGSSGYGRNSYDFQDGSMIFVKPDQVLISSEDEIEEDSRGWSLIFHPDLIRSYELAGEMNNFSFFSYDVNEALHLSRDEKNHLSELVKSIEKEYQQNIDEHTEELIVANLSTILKYCKRYYNRQFYTRANLNKDYLSMFERYLKSYFDQGKHLEKGLPTVDHCGTTLNMSGQYLSDLLKIETGKTALEHIHLFVIDKAKNSLLNSNKTISQIAYDLGFDYSQNFSRLFKLKTGMSPKEFRTLN